PAPSSARSRYGAVLTRHRLRRVPPGLTARRPRRAAPPQAAVRARRRILASRRRSPPRQRSRGPREALRLRRQTTLCPRTPLRASRRASLLPPQALDRRRAHRAAPRPDRLPPQARLTDPATPSPPGPFPRRLCPQCSLAQGGRSVSRTGRTARPPAHLRQLRPPSRRLPPV